MMPFEWVVGDSSKDHTVTAPTFTTRPATAGYTTLRGTTQLPDAFWLDEVFGKLDLASLVMFLLFLKETVEPPRVV